MNANVLQILSDPWPMLAVLLICVAASCAVALLRGGVAEKKRREERVEKLRARLNE